ncbi:MAG: DNA alkylation repair protein [Chthoniobacterales bacterium]
MTSKKIRQLLHSQSNPATAKQYKRFFKTEKGDYAENDRFLGIRIPVLRKYAKEYREILLSEVIPLLQSPYHEERMFALLLLVEKFTKGTPQDKKATYQTYVKHISRVNNWDLVDTSAPYIVGAYLEDKDRHPLYTWVKSPNLWKRRIAILSTFHFIRKNDFHDALELSSILLHDKEDLIHKAVGWMLREIGNRDQNVERHFLNKHHQTMPRTMLRYAIEKFSEKERKKYLNG